jgi:hypothetical protein
MGSLGARESLRAGVRGGRGGGVEGGRGAVAGLRRAALRKGSLQEGGGEWGRGGEATLREEE